MASTAQDVHEFDPNLDSLTSTQSASTSTTAQKKDPSPIKLLDFPANIQCQCNGFERWVCKRQRERSGTAKVPA
jgi:hypothetical protein